jgi:Tfp pilus assembly protein PilV
MRPCSDVKGQRSKVKGSPAGLTLIEVIVGVALVSTLTIVFGISLTAAVYAQRIKLRNMASALADQQLAVLQAVDTSTVSTQTKGPLLGVLFTKGSWAAVTDGTAPSPDRALESTASSATGVTAVMPLPKNAYGDFTQTASFKVGTNPPSGWRVGFLFRASDLRNQYQAYLTANAFVLKKVVNGAETTLYSDVRTILPDVWQTLSVTTNGSSISVTLNGSSVTSQTDSTFSAGKAALAVWEGAMARFDDVGIEGQVWNFDATTLGEIPSDWLRFGLADLPSGDAVLTIATPYADTSYRTYTVDVSWKDRSGVTRSISHSTQKSN